MKYTPTIQIRPRYRTLIQSVRSCYKARVSIVAITLALLPLNADAQIVSDSYSCYLGEQSRSITLVYLDKPEQVPCEIRELTDSGSSRTLWRADNDGTFCRRQFESYHDKLESIGWPCESAPSVNQQYKETTDPVVSLFIESSVTTRSVPIAAITTAKAPELQPKLQPQQSIELLQNKSEFQIQHLYPAPPAGKNSNLTADDIREMDDWLIYLSAQTMASIRTLVPTPATFEEYQQSEPLDSSDIYERLQNRIEFLNKLLLGQTSVKTELSAAEN